MASGLEVKDKVSDKAGGRARSIGYVLQTAALCIAGWLLGYLISGISSVVLFSVAHLNPERPASLAVMAGVSVYGIVFAMIGAAIGASLSRPNALGIGLAIALTNWAMAAWSWSQTPGASHWTHLLAIVLMAPAAVLGAYLCRVRA